MKIDFKMVLTERIALSFEDETMKARDPSVIDQGRRKEN